MPTIDTKTPRSSADLIQPGRRDDDNRSATVDLMLEISANGDRPLDDVWDRYTRPALWSTWAPQIQGVRCADDVIVVGSRGVVRGPLVVRVPFVIESVDHAGHCWTWRVGVGPLSVRMDHGVEQTGTGVRAWARLHVPAVVAMPYAPIARIALRRLVKAG